MDIAKTFDGHCPKCGYECGGYHADIDKCLHCGRRVKVKDGSYIQIGKVEYFLCDYCLDSAIAMLEDTGSIS